MNRWMLALAVLFLVISSVWAEENNGGDRNGASTDSASYVSIAAIKSVSGQRPEDEFFDVNFKFQYKYFFTMAGLDIALSDTNSSSKEKHLTEAGISLNWGFADAKDRQPFVGFMLKQFNAEPYWGFILGSIELKRSDLYPSHVTIAPLLYAINAKADSTRSNIYTEFLIRSDKVDFFKVLAVKGGILIPVNYHWSFPEFIESRRDIKYRIAIEVPVGGVHTF